MTALKFLHIVTKMEKTILEDDKITQAARRYYPHLAASWAEETRHKDYRDLPEGMPQSYGQCLPTSVVLLEQLRLDFPSEAHKLNLASGAVYSTETRQPIIPDHLWVSRTHIDHDLKLTYGSVIDPTSDQAVGETLEPIEIATIDELIKRGIAYTAIRTFVSVDDLIASVEKPKTRDNVAWRIGLLRGRFLPQLAKYQED